ncbi:MAG: TraR/DksA C4-type zinc finger protein [Albidovulum sp.]|uniref:TraR/DksA family transcriptional regulator n=1 Tax=Albidovulum sp. TaxID=1872424 RepID=UPI003C7FF447
MSEPSDAELAARYRPVIEAELADLGRATEATSTDRKPVELDQQSVGRLSRMDAMQGQAMAAAVEARRGQRRVALQAALRRLEEGEFGWCAGCGGFIGTGRLDVDPVAVICIACAQ